MSLFEGISYILIPTLGILATAHCLVLNKVDTKS